MSEQLDFLSAAISIMAGGSLTILIVLGIYMLGIMLLTTEYNPNTSTWDDSND